MGKKKGTKGKKGAKGKAGKKSSKGSALKTGLETQANRRAMRRRQMCLARVEWAPAFRVWMERERARVFDEFRMLDTDRDGCLTPAEFEAGLHLLAAPITDEGLRSLTAACDLQADQRIPYCQEPVLMRCYAGGLQELVNTGMERVMAAHRLEMADIGEAHAADLKSIADGKGLPLDPEEEAAKALRKSKASALPRKELTKNDSVSDGEGSGDGEGEASQEGEGEGEGSGEEGEGVGSGEEGEGEGSGEEGKGEGEGEEGEGSGDEGASGGEGEADGGGEGSGEEGDSGGSEPEEEEAGEESGGEGGSGSEGD